MMSGTKTPAAAANAAADALTRARQNAELLATALGGAHQAAGRSRMGLVTAGIG